MARKFKNNGIGGSGSRKSFKRKIVLMRRKDAEKFITLDNLGEVRNSRKKDSFVKDGLGIVNNYYDGKTREYYNGLIECIIRESDKEIYLDSNHITGPGHIFESIFTRFINDLPKLGIHQWPAGFNYYGENFNYVSKKIDKIFREEKVQVSTGVVNEMFRYKLKVRNTMRENKINLKTGERVISSIRDICFTMKKKLEDNKWKDNDSVNNEIFLLLKSLNYNVNKTDKGIISLALSSGLNDGRNKLILTWDKGIKDSIHNFYRFINDNPEALDLCEYCTSFLDYKKVNLRVGGLIFGNDEINIGNVREYRNFFKGKILEEL